jgi:tetratricopeptide (TPR) repeat protein
MLELPGVTLVCIDCVQHELALAAIEQTLLRCRFAETLFVTDREIPIEELRVVQVPPIRTYAEYSRFVAKDLVGFISTPHALIIHWDAFVVNPSAWSDAFLAFDHVAAMASAGSGDRASSAGGISLLSQRMMNALRDPRMAEIADGDKAIRLSYRPLLEGEFGLRYAPRAIADRFAFGASYPIGQPFGFQGLFNMWMFFQPQDLNAFLAMASPAILASPAALSLGVNLRDLGRSDEAKAVLRAILGAHPGHAVAQTVLAAMQRLATPGALAAQPARTAVGRNDPCPCGSGQKFKQCHGRLSGAPALAQAPLAAEPVAIADSFVAEGGLGVLFHRARAALASDDLAAAETMYRKALERLPGDPVATGYLGVIATKLHRFDEAEPLLLQAIEIAPDAPEYHNNLGLFHQVRGEFAAAAAAYRRALEIAPEYAPAHNNLGLALQEQGLVAEAILSFRAAIRYLPEFAEAHWNLALALLLTGELEEGLVEQEWRLKVVQPRDWWARRRQFPQWNGEALAAKRFLILAEQGMGDMIQFVRYAEDLVARGATVLVEAPADLTDLLCGAPGVAAVVPHNGPYPQCDYQAPAMSLPLRCGTRLETIPARAHYLAADPLRVRRWRELLGQKNKPRVGVAWAGNPDHVRDAFRSMPLAALMPLLAIQGVEWISLQKGAAAAQMATLPSECALRDAAKNSRNFADLAALISELDLVISVDTAVVHLAGALGRPTLLLLDTGHDWRWLQNRTDSPWYPTVRLIRQAVRGDWPSAIALTRIELSRQFDL